MNEAQRMAEVEKFKNYFSYINRPGADKLLEWLEQIGFFTAPASSKYHGAYAGGLVEHSNNVYRRLVKLADEEDKRQGRQFPEYAVDTIAVVTLLHDVCKADAYKVEKKNQKQKDGRQFSKSTVPYRPERSAKAFPRPSLPTGLVKNTK